MMQEFKSVKYLKTEQPDGSILNPSGIKATIDGQELFIPISVDNRHYDAIMKEVEEGNLTIEAAE